MVLKIQRNILLKKVAKNNRSRDISQRNGALKNIAFLVAEKDCESPEFLYKLDKELKVKSKDITTFVFLESKRKVPSLKQNQVSFKDFNWKGDLTNTNAKQFLDRDFDALVGYYTSSDLYLDYMMSQSKAKFKIGLKNCNESLFDLILGVTTQEKEKFNTELIKYLKILEKI